MDPSDFVRSKSHLEGSKEGRWPSNHPPELPRTGTAIPFPSDERERGRIAGRDKREVLILRESLLYRDSTVPRRSGSELLCIARIL